ncbi:GNAT family N-acetyltransferase [Erythrobacter sp. SCSIO 43205]|uniref:GNAT family N-acetyltransferase n=1 Tax=Erythrobacter sp. SCSIO 43205 TaxID=2779361 RepID=UPI001CA8393E|nr:GNAT family N-acetyltransferase [Erythrobacter sp. SCSIO 43205]UAB77742.1 GNAT family N-acetyltransferase [Erythrobacter sp. SCSIO 43205]
MRDDRPIETVPDTAKLEPLARTLGAAFQNDPALSWIVPDAKRREAMLPGFFKVMAEQSRRHGEILASPDEGAVSLWYPPGKVSDGFFATTYDNLRLLAGFRIDLPRGLKVAEEMYKRHPSPQPYSYLRYVGVAPKAQGKGWGGAIVRAGIKRAASKGQGVLLETATPDNVAIYTRLGFEILEEWEVPGGGPKFWTMIHPAP